jgi:hypothetical protein
VLDTASRASRPLGGAYGAPGPRIHHVVRGSYASKLTLAGYRQATIENRGLDKRSLHISEAKPQGLRRSLASRVSWKRLTCAGDVTNVSPVARTYGSRLDDRQWQAAQS